MQISALFLHHSSRVRDIALAMTDIPLLVAGEQPPQHNRARVECLLSA
jgi:hypothetical protein